MTQINPYLVFEGNCREAMNFYHDCLGGELTMTTVAEWPEAAKMPAETHNLIMHARLQKGIMVLMASDNCNNSPAATIGDAIGLALNCASEEEIDTYFEKLSAGGQVIHPLKEEYWGGKFANVKDKFGMTWLLNFMRKQEE